MDKIISNEELLKISNDTTFQKYYNQFTLLALNMFQWENLPDGIETRHIEKPLIEFGYSFFYNDDDYGFVCLPCTITGFNIYNEPTRVTINNQIIHKSMDVDEGVLILNNDLRTGLYPIIINYASRLSEIETSINTNIYQQKFPFIVECSKDNEMSVRQMIKNIHENEPYILVKKKLDLMDIKIDDLSVPYVADKLLEDKKKIENELLTLFGLNNVADKKERLIVDEANANNDYINRNVDLLYKNRKIACDKINEKFGLNINVKRVNNIEEKHFIEEV